MTTSKANTLERFPLLSPGLKPSPASPPVRVCIATPEVIGPYKCGGIGTLYTTLAESLASAGHDVTLLYLRGSYCENGTIAEWVGRYGRKNIRLVPLPAPADPPVHGALNAVTAHHAYRWLKAHAFDIVHFPELGGPGYFAMLAKRQGLAFARTRFVVGTHGPTHWVREANAEPLLELFDLENDFAERQSVRFADVVWSPSRYLLQWMEGRGWPLGEHCRIQPYILPQAARTAAPDACAETRTVCELVFFGRLETRKGLTLFADALDEIAATRCAESALEVTFLGRNWNVSGEDSESYIARRAERWPWPWQVLTELSQPEAMAYLRSDNRLAVMPSFMDNSPNTVYECLGSGIPFIASDSGGIPELIHPEDVERVTVTLERRALAERLQDALVDGVRAARPAIDFVANEAAWIGWHEKAADELRAIEVPNVEAPAVEPGTRVSVISAPDPGPAGPQWNAAAASVEGDYLLFVDERHELHPDAVAGFVRAATSLHAGVVTGFRDHVDSGERAGLESQRIATEVFLGGSASLGAFENCFGDGPVLVRRDVFDTVGGFPEGARETCDFVWAFCERAVLAGFRHEVVPEPLSSRRAEKLTTPAAASDPYPDHFPAMREVALALPRPIAAIAHAGGAIRHRRRQAKPDGRPSAAAARRPTETLLGAARLLAEHGASQDAFRVLGRAEETAIDSGRALERVQVELVSSYVHARSGRPEEARRRALHAVELADGSGETRTRFEATLRSAEVAALLEDLELSKRLHLSALQHARRLNQPEALIEALTSAGIAHVALDETELAKELWTAASKLAAQNRFTGALERVQALLAETEHLPGG